MPCEQTHEKKGSNVMFDKNRKFYKIMTEKWKGEVKKDFDL